MSITSAASTAISAPVPIATPTSALASAGASFIPSPTIITFLPVFCKSLICSSLSAGLTPATTLFTPVSFPMARAVRSLSPVSITTSIPRELSSFTACLLPSLITSATAIIPSSSFLFSPFAK